MGNKFGAEYHRRYREKNKEKIRERHHRWCADNPDKVAAATKKFKLNHPYVSQKRIGVPERKGCLITIRQEQIYKLVSPDFYGLQYWAAAKLMHVSPATICLELKKIKQKCPSLFPLRVHRMSRQRIKERMAKYGGKRKIGILSSPFSYADWMDYKIVKKF